MDRDRFARSTTPRWSADHSRPLRLRRVEFQCPLLGPNGRQRSSQIARDARRHDPMPSTTTPLEPSTDATAKKICSSVSGLWKQPAKPSSVADSSSPKYFGVSPVPKTPSVSAAWFLFKPLMTLGKNSKWQPNFFVLHPIQLNKALFYRL
jgi:hypothetical protein